MVYVALLRGINVGGKNKVSMGELKEIFLGLGFASVKTYINSGNIIFTAQEKPAVLKGIIEDALKKKLSFEIIVLVKSLAEYIEIAESIPSHLTNDKMMKSDVLFLFESIDNETILEEIPQRKDVDNMVYVPGAIIFWTSREDVGKSQLAKIIGKNIYKEMTIRNVNTVRKILELMKKPT